MSKKNKQLSQIAKLLMTNRKKIRIAKLEKRKAQCECLHQSPKGNTWLRADKKHKADGEPIVKCKECKDRVDLGPIFNKDRAGIREYVKETCRAFMNLCNLNKISITPKMDGKYGEMLGKAQFAAYKVMKFSKMNLGDGFEPKKGKKKGKKGKKGRLNFRLGGGGVSYNK